MGPGGREGGDGWGVGSSGLSKEYTSWECCQTHGYLYLSPSIYSQQNIHNSTKVYLCPTQQDTGEFHTSVHLKVGELEHMEEVEPREQWSRCLQSQPHDRDGWAHSFRKPSSSRRTSTHDFGLPTVGAPMATGNWEAVAVGPGTLSLQLLMHPQPWPPIHGSRTLMTPNMVEKPAQPCSPPIIPLFPQQSLCLRGSQTQGKSLPSSWHSSSGRSKAATTPEAQEVTKKAWSHTSYKDSGGWKVPILKNNQR